jgi:hypothetical protein
VSFGKARSAASGIAARQFRAHMAQSNNRRPCTCTRHTRSTLVSTRCTLALLHSCASSFVCDFHVHVHVHVHILFLDSSDLLYRTAKAHASTGHWPGLVTIYHLT